MFPGYCLALMALQPILATATDNVQRPLQAMLEAADKLATASPQAVVFDKKRKGELAAKLSQRWQRWELSNFDYLMQVYLHHSCLITCTLKIDVQQGALSLFDALSLQSS